MCHHASTAPFAFSSSSAPRLPVAPTSASARIPLSSDAIDPRLQPQPFTTSSPAPAAFTSFCASWAPLTSQTRLQAWVQAHARPDRAAPPPAPAPSAGDRHQLRHLRCPVTTSQRVTSCAWTRQSEGGLPMRPNASEPQLRDAPAAAARAARNTRGGRRIWIGRRRRELDLRDVGFWSRPPRSGRCCAGCSPTRSPRRSPSSCARSDCAAASKRALRVSRWASVSSSCRRALLPLSSVDTDCGDR